MSDNPYQTPPPDNPFRDAGGGYGPYEGKRPDSMTGHVRVVSILMIVQGALELLCGLMLGVFAVVVPLVMREELRNAPQGPGQPPPEFMLAIMPAIYGTTALGGLVAGGLHLTAGIKNYRFRGRTLGFTALIVGFAACLTCDCAPTAIGLAVYGLIVYNNASVRQAFEAAETGLAGDDILKRY